MFVSRLVRSLVALAVLAVAGIAGSASFALAMASRQPDLVLRFVPDEPNALGQAAYRRLTSDNSSDALRRSKRQASKALRYDPTNLYAATTLAIAAQFEGRDRDARRLMSYAANWSRRNFPVNLWLIEFYAKRGDLDAALGQINAALLTSSSAPTVLFPTLVQALDNRLVNDRLAQMLATRPVWGDHFIQHAAQNISDIAPVATLLIKMRGRGGATPDLTLQSVIDRAVKQGKFALAHDVYRAYRKPSSGSLLNNPDFSKAPEIPTAFDWEMSNEEVTASHGANGIDLSAAAGVRGVAARQIIMLPVGEYQIQGVTDDPSANGDKILIDVRCAKDDTILAVTTARKPGAFRIGSACRFQSVAISVSNQTGADRVSSSLRRIDLRRL